MYSMLAEELQNSRTLYHIYSSVLSISGEQEDFLRNPIRIVAAIVNVKKDISRQRELIENRDENFSVVII